MIIQVLTAITLEAHYEFAVSALSLEAETV